ncbi:hypothetical protein LCGC14_0505260 [marine sediment metagenome]|uniref:Cytochrome b561 bacterial/Ni-hydrogenase domain-containing protein n=1 Tax=marine sediment metagenome TaxID=412755 RepID=A0A0F9SL77_9ZZZZ|nr:cytochrome b [Methylophaga sp.]
MMTSIGHSLSTRLLHWAMAFIIISMLCLGSSMIQSLDTWQMEAVKLHKSFGIVALILVIVRLFNKLISKSPPLPNDLPKWQKFAAHVTHFSLYALMLAMPISGWLMQSADGREVSLFNLITLPQLIHADIKMYSLFREIHGYVASLFFLILFMHIGAALYHGLVRRDGVLSSMTSGK